MNGVDGESLKGYEIHMGRTTGSVGLFNLKRRGSFSELVADGSAQGTVWGTYIHGIFDNDRFRRNLINSLRAARGFATIDDVTDFAKARNRALDRWAEVLRTVMDMKFIEELISR